MVELSAIWVVIIILIGIAIGVYSICKGCQGMREQAAAAQQAQHERMATAAPYAGIVQQLRSEDTSQSHLFLISGSTVYDKNPPSYDEIIEPPPSYEETIKWSPSSSQSSPCEGAAHVNLGCDVSEDQERGACSHPPAAVHGHDASNMSVPAQSSSQVNVTIES